MKDLDRMIRGKGSNCGGVIRGKGSNCGGVNIRYIYVMNTDTVLDVMNIISLRSLFISNLLADAVLVRASVQNT